MFELVSLNLVRMYCTFGRGKINAWFPRSALARDFVNFRKKIHASRPRGATARV
jgi:hypothetical protein